MASYDGANLCKFL